MTSELPLEILSDSLRLSRKLCASKWLDREHEVSRAGLEKLLSHSEVTETLGLEHIWIWSVCSLDKSSSVILQGNNGHIVVDGFQLRALSRVMSSIALRAGSKAAECELLALMAEEFLRVDDVETARLCMKYASRGLKEHPEAFAMVQIEPVVRFLHHIQRLFVLGHELGHLMLDSPNTKIDLSAFGEHMETRLRDLQQELQELRDVQSGLREQGVEDEDQDIIDSMRWNLVAGDAWFRDELMCDGLSIELLEHTTTEFAGVIEDRRLHICEAIVATAMSLDILRLIRRFVSSRAELTEEGSLKALFDHHFIRSVHMSKLVHMKFGVTSQEIAPFLSRFEQVFSGGPGGLRRMFGLVKIMPLLVGDGGQAQNTAEDRRKLEAEFGWLFAPTAMRQTMIF
ncbi:hypothetical protein HFO26_06460 [Rhizobium leguminosarum]|nr:hypothetical protein [Rhizobium leguminosarum]MBY5729935.1 hypothetical protein [Rhizobium leguminosarum]